MLIGWKGTGMSAEVIVMHPTDFVRLCEETRSMPVAGCLAWPVNGKRLEFRPSRTAPVGQALFTSLAVANAWRAS